MPSLLLLLKDIVCPPTLNCIMATDFGSLLASLRATQFILRVSNSKGSKTEAIAARDPYLSTWSSPLPLAEPAT